MGGLEGDGREAQVFINWQGWAKRFLKIIMVLALAGWLSWSEHCPIYQRGCRLNFQSGYIPRLRFDPQSGS